MPHVQVFSNADAEMTRLVRPAYAARTGRPEPVDIMVLPPGTLLRGDAQWVVQIGDAVLREQVPPNWTADAPIWKRLSSCDPQTVESDRDILLIARFGLRTWGHWMGELLPKIVVCERRQPGRFTYALPGAAFDREQGGLLAMRLAESLSAYGIGMSRVLMLDERAYRFARLFAVTSVWTDRMMHPAVLADMRERTEPGGDGHSGSRQVALLRGDNDRRQIANAVEVKACLTARGFDVLDIAEQDFSAQLAIFRSARTIFSILGSSLSGLIYAREGVEVIAAAPDRFADRFFYALMQARKARYAEVRGPVAGEPHKIYRDSSFVLPVAALDQAIACFPA